jgi:glycosyltransferase involved in cell wall biosynthesis
MLQEMLARGEAVPGETIDSEVAVDHGNCRARDLQERNKGKGSSVRRALAAARGEWIIVQDADLEYDPQDYLKLLAAAQKWEAAPGRKGRDVAVLERVCLVAPLRGATQLQDAFLVGTHRPFGCVSSALCDVAFRCGDVLQIDARRVAQSLDLQADGFDLDFEIAARLAAAWRAHRRSADFLSAARQG